MISIIPPPPYFPIATREQLSDISSWINNSYEIPAEPYTRFFLALGEGIAAWAIVESTLFGVAAHTIQARNLGALTRAYDNLTTFRTKLDFVDAAVRGSYEDAVITDEWVPLYNKLKAKSAKRNAMAHSQVWYDHNEPKGNRKFFISAEIRKGPDGTRLFENDLRSIKESFDRLSLRCFNFYTPPEQPEGSVAPERRHGFAGKERGRPVYLTHKVPSPPPQSSPE